jgi:hypothetical protein
MKKENIKKETKPKPISKVIQKKIKKLEKELKIYNSDLN